MMSNYFNKKRILIILFCLVIVISVRWSTVQHHEEVHQKIYATYGVDSYIFNNVIKGYTKTINFSQVNLTREEYLQMQLSHNINEAILYNLSGIDYLLTVIAVLLFAILVRIKRNDEST